MAESSSGSSGGTTGIVAIVAIVLLVMMGFFVFRGGLFRSGGGQFAGVQGQRRDQDASAVRALGPRGRTALALRTVRIS